MTTASENPSPPLPATTANTSSPDTETATSKAYWTTRALDIILDAGQRNALTYVSFSLLVHKKARRYSSHLLSRSFSTGNDINENRNMTPLGVIGRLEADMKMDVGALKVFEFYSVLLTVVRGTLKVCSFPFLPFFSFS